MRLCSFHVVFVSGSVLSLPLATHFCNLFLFLVRIRPDLTKGTQLIFFLSCYPFVIFLSKYLTHCYLRTKQSVSDTHKIRCTYLWDSSARTYSLKTKKSVLHESFVHLLSAHRLDRPHTILNVWLSCMILAQTHCFTSISLVVIL